MRNVFIGTCAAIVLSAAAIIGWSNLQAPKPAAVSVAGTSKTQFKVEQLANGATVYREVPAEGELEDIAPAAGDSASFPDKTPRYKYDPLTQTYRATRPDGSQDIIRDPLNPSKN